MRKSFDIGLAIDGEERNYRITPSFQAIGEIESHEVHRGADGSLMAMLRRFSLRSQRLSDYVAIIHGALRASGEKDATAEEIGEAIVDAGPINFVGVCVMFLNEALGVDESSLAKAAKRKAGTKKKRKRQAR